MGYTKQLCIAASLLIFFMSMLESSTSDCCLVRCAFDTMQGDKEQALSLPISPLMDRAHQGGMTRSQVIMTHD